jgi:hypothetical protein
MNQKLSKISEGLYFRPLQFYISSESSINVFIHDKRKLIKKEKKVMLWKDFGTLKNN